MPRNHWHDVNALRANLNVGCLPIMASWALRAIRKHNKQALLRVIGTDVLYAYEALAGVMFNSETTATGGIDKLKGGRSRLSLLTEADEQIGLIRLVQSQVDKTFQPPIKMDFRLIMIPAICRIRVESRIRSSSPPPARLLCPSANRQGRLRAVLRRFRLLFLRNDLSAEPKHFSRVIRVT
jgi:hypothetical protein